LAYLLGYHSLKITLLGGDMRLLRLSFLGKANGLRNSNKTIRSYFSFEETNTKTKTEIGHKNPKA